MVAPNVRASMAPRAAPAEMPSVNGVASGLRSSAWKTTPDEARAAPTRAAARTRGRRATKKICASTLVAQGSDQSNALDRLIDVLPASGARMHAARAAAADTAATVATRALGGRHDGLARGAADSGRAIIAPVQSARRPGARPRRETARRRRCRRAPRWTRASAPHRSARLRRRGPRRPARRCRTPMPRG